MQNTFAAWKKRLTVGTQYQEVWNAVDGKVDHRPATITKVTSEGVHITAPSVPWCDWMSFGKPEQIQFTRKGWKHLDFLEESVMNRNTPSPYQKQYDEQLAYLNGLVQGLDPHSPLAASITLARAELVREGPGKNGILSLFLEEAADRILRLRQSLCAIPH